MNKGTKVIYNGEAYKVAKTEGIYVYIRKNNNQEPIKVLSRNCIIKKVS